MDQILYGHRQQPYVLWHAGALAVALTGVLATGMTYAAMADVSGGGVPGVVAAAGRDVAVTAGAASSGCAEALARAEEVLTEARAVDRALATQVQAANDVLAGRVLPQQALDRTLPALTRGAQRSAAFAQAEQRYRSAAQSCR